MADIKNEWRWQGPVGGATAEAFAEEIYLVLEAAHDRNMVGQWTTGSYCGDHSDRIEEDLLPRLLDFMRLLVMASKPSVGIPFNEPLCGRDAKDAGMISEKKTQGDHLTLAEAQELGYFDADVDERRERSRTIFNGQVRTLGYVDRVTGERIYDPDKIAGTGKDRT